MTVQGAPAAATLQDWSSLACLSPTAVTAGQNYHPTKRRAILSESRATQAGDHGPLPRDGWAVLIHDTLEAYQAVVCR